jgi:hypothetical protein
VRCEDGAAEEGTKGRLGPRLWRALFVFYKLVVRARASLYRKRRESGDFGEGKAKLRWSDGLEVAGRQRNGGSVTPRLRLRESGLRRARRG